MLLQTLRWLPATAESDVMHVSTGLPGKPDYASYACCHLPAQLFAEPTHPIKYRPCFWKLA